MPERIKLIVEYDGTNYSGWQRQINAMSVQQRLEEGLKKLTGESITVTGSSRTDAGVHSKGQTVHFDMQTPIRLSRALRRDRQGLSLHDIQFAARQRAQCPIHRACVAAAGRESYECGSTGYDRQA